MERATWSWSADQAELRLAGAWTAQGVGRMRSLVRSESAHFTINALDLTALDCAGALELVKFCRSISLPIAKVAWVGLSTAQLDLIQQVDADWQPSESVATVKGKPLVRLGKRVVAAVENGMQFLHFAGHVVVTLLSLFTGKIRFQPALFARNVEETGFKAIGIVSLLSFLIGMVLAYQVVFMLSGYGASIYVVKLTGIITLREFGPIITAIILAGRTATAFAAEIGTMKVQEEVDALHAFGVEPIERLVLPKLFALLLVMPLLVVLADVAGVFGGMVMAKLQAGIAFPEFIGRLKEELQVTQLWLGFVKMPVFALAIALVGTYQGFSVTQSAQSVGQRTTRAAVHAIFWVIVINAIFSIAYSAYGV